MKNTLTAIFTEAYGLLRPCPAGLRILLYHAVGSTVPFEGMGLSISPELFRAHMRALKEEASFALSPVSLASLDGKRRAAVTFDDGYRDNLTAAAPILAELSIPFTVYVVPAYIKSGDPLYLTTAQLKELAQAPGCQIGSHGMNHRHLGNLSPAEVQAELRESRLWLEDTLGRAVTTISYPYGSSNRAVGQAAAAAGYTLGVCSRTGANEAERDPLMLCRTEILEWDGPRRFRQKLRGAWDWHRFRRADPAAS